MYCPAFYVMVNLRTFKDQYISLRRACNLTSFSPCLTGSVDYLFASRHKGPRFKSPGGYLCEAGILLLTLSHYIGDPDVIDHHCLVWGGPRPEPSLGLRTNNVTIPLDPTQLSCLGFMLAAGLPSNRRSWLLGGSPVEILQSHFFLTMSHWSSGLPVCFPSQGTQVQIPRGYLCETGILLLALSRYKSEKPYSCPHYGSYISSSCESQ